jgi:hypothetical protein
MYHILFTVHHLIDIEVAFTFGLTMNNAAVNICLPFLCGRVFVLGMYLGVETDGFYQTLKSSHGCVMVGGGRGEKGKVRHNS